MSGHKSRGENRASSQMISTPLGVLEFPQYLHGTLRGSQQRETRITYVVSTYFRMVVLNSKLQLKHTECLQRTWVLWSECQHFLSIHMVGQLYIPMILVLRVQRQKDHELEVRLG